VLLDAGVYMLLRALLPCDPPQLLEEEEEEEEEEEAEEDSFCN